MAGRPASEGHRRKAAAAKRRPGLRRSEAKKPARKEAAIRGELCQALMSVAGMEIDDVYPPSGSNEDVPVPCGSERASLREVTGNAPRPGSHTQSNRMAMRSAPRPGKATRGTKRGAAALRPNGRDLPNDELAIRDEVRKAFMSIRGMKIDDVYPPSGGDEQIRD